MADLSIDSGLCYPGIAAVVLLVRHVINEHTSRITELSLTVIDSVLWILLEGLVRRPPSLRLRELHLRRTSQSFRPFPNAILLPNHLQVLEADGFNVFGKSSQLFPRLTDLTIGPLNVVVPLSDFITAFRGMPALEVLHLRYSLPSHSPVSCVQPAHLAKLRKLDVISSSPLLPNFLDLITVPASTDIRIHCVRGTKYRYIALVKPSAIASSLQRLIRRMHSEDEAIDGHYYNSVWIRSTGDGLNIIASRADIEASHFALNCDLTVDRVVDFTSEQCLRKVSPAILREEVLSLKLEMGVSSKTLLEISDTLPCLRTVQLGRESMPNFIAVMMLERPSSPPFPNIQRLVLSNARFSSRINGGLEVRELRHCVERRSKLKELSIIRCCGILNHDIQRLREIVEVEWDGFESRV